MAFQTVPSRRAAGGGRDRNPVRRGAARETIRGCGSQCKTIGRLRRASGRYTRHGRDSMKAILVHGMGRSPLSQLLLAKRLRSSGIRVHLFGYSTFVRFNTSLSRLVKRVATLGGDEPFILVGHSLGCVLIRAALPRLGRQPAGCFFLAPPNIVPRAARFFSSNPLYRFYTGDSGQLLLDDAFMAALPIPEGIVRVYAGTAGYRGKWSPFHDEANDGVLSVAETMLPNGHEPVLVPALHTFIMNSEAVADDIATAVASLR
jgi:pimeloyl-ACP methyl ester carboxylesterase